MAKEVEWEAEIKIRRNGRLVRRDSALGDTPGQALYLASNNLEREFWNDTVTPDEAQG